MKKLLILILSLILVSALAFSLVSCGGDDNAKDNNGEDNTNTDSEGENNNTDNSSGGNNNNGVEDNGKALALSVLEKTKNAGKILSFDINFRMDIYRDFEDAKKAYKPFRLVRCPIYRYKNTRFPLNLRLQPLVYLF